MNSNNVKALSLDELLDELSNNLQNIGWWQMEPPSSAALASLEPFAMGTLLPQQWLQWIFIPKMRYLLHTKANLPTSLAIAAYFEEVWKNQPNTLLILATIREIDKVKL